MAGSSSSLGSAEGCDISAIADAWDCDPGLRVRIRDGLQLFRETSDKNYDLRTPANNKALLKPVLNRMRECGRKIPSIDHLRHEVTVLLKLNRHEISNDDVEHAAWNIRKHAGFIKMKVRRGEPSQASLRIRASFIGTTDAKHAYKRSYMLVPSMSTHTHIYICALL